MPIFLKIPMPIQTKILIPILAIQNSLCFYNRLKKGFFKSSLFNQLDN